MSSAACIAGKDPDKIAQLPDTTGLKNEIVMKKKQRYSYGRSYTVPGGKIVEAGDEDGCTREELERAIGPNTAAVAYLVRPDEDTTVVSLEDAVEIAHAHGIPAIGDAAAQIYPLEYFRRNAQTPDLACFGAKYFGAPHSAGFLCGKKDMVDAAASHGFVAFQHQGGRAFGRPMKVDRQEIIGVAAALEAWLTMNHEDRLLGYEDKLSTLQRGLRGTTHIMSAKIVRNGNYWGAGLQVALDSDSLGMSAQQVADELDEGEPCILVNVEGDDTLAVNVHTLNEGEEQIIADRLNELLG